jgi:Tol biopolymer transport system component
MTRTESRSPGGLGGAEAECAAAAARPGPPTLRRRGVAALCLGLALAAPATPAWAAKDDTDLVSRAGGAAGTKGDNDSALPAVSADGRFVAFTSGASSLHPDDGDFTFDVFVRDLQANTTTLVSRAGGAAGTKGNGGSIEPAISADGRFVAFSSNASNLHPDDGDGTFDVFVRDLRENTLTLVSRAGGAAGTKGNGGSFEPAISADGRFVAFSSGASNLHPDDGDGIVDVFVRDLEANTTTLVSRATGAAGDKGNNHFSQLAISADGRFVAFRTGATNLHPDDGDGFDDVFVRDLQANTTTLVSRANGAAGDKGNGDSGESAISADGRFVAFGSGASNLHPDDSDNTADVFVRDLQADTTTLVSRAAGAAGEKGNDFSFEPAISADGRSVAFSSFASNLHPDDGDSVQDVFRRDVLGPPPGPAVGQPPAAQPPAAPGGPAQPGCPLAGNVVRGTNGDDERSGGALTDNIFGRGGDDLLRGLAGADCLYGQRGADRLVGGRGRDGLFGGRGRDRLSGGRSSDRINPGGARDRVAAGRGNDLVLARGAARDTIDCGRGRKDMAIVDQLDDTRRCEDVRLP